MISDEIIPLGIYRFDTRASVLRDGKGNVVALRSQSMKVLARLCKEPGEIVSKPVLFEDIWGETYVTDASLVQCIREIRNTLSDDDFKLIRTFPRQGYMVVPSEKAGSTVEASTRLPVVTVLTFEGEKDTAKGGITNDLIAAMTKYSDLSVVSQRTVAALSARALTIREIASETGSDYVLCGRVRNQDGNAQIAVELIDAEADCVVWTEAFEIAASGTGDGRADVVDKIAATLGYLTTYFRPPAGNSGMGRAVRLHLEARLEMNKQTDASIERAEKLNRLAVKADPTLTFGYVGLAFTFYLRHGLDLWPAGPEDALRIADEFAEKAVAIAPDDPSVLFARSAVFSSQGKIEMSTACLERAIQLNPSDSSLRVALAEDHAFMGNVEASLKQIELASHSDVVYPDWLKRSRAFILWAADRHTEALEGVREDPLTPTGLLLQKCVILVANGCLDEARQTMETFKSERPNHSIDFEYLRMAKKFRDKSKAQAWIEALRMAGLPE